MHLKQCLFLFFLIFLTNIRAQTCTTQPLNPTDGCSYCPTAPTVSFGVGQTGSQFMQFGNSPGSAPTTSTSRMLMEGLYHYFYTGSCLGAVTTSLQTQDCNFGTVSTNAQITLNQGATLYGYETSTDVWYPPEPGHYLVIVTAIGGNTGGVVTNVQINAANGGSPDVVAQAQINSPSTLTSMSASTIITYNAIGANRYIYISASNIYQDNPGSLTFTRLSISRIA